MTFPTGTLCAFGAVLALLPATSFASGPDEAWARDYFINGGPDMPACGVCHALADAGTAGEVGPNLDDLQPDLSKVRAAVRDGVGVMPPFGRALSEAEVEAMAAYIAEVTR